jgi:hypothetical protein
MFHVFFSARSRQMVVCVAAVIALAGCSSPDEGFTVPGRTDNAVAVTEVEPGQCFSVDPAAEAVESVELVGCDRAHNAEVMSSATLDESTYSAGDVYDAAAIATATHTLCEQALLTYVGPNATGLGLTYQAFTPSIATWQSSGDRTITCYATTTTGDKTLTASVKDTGQ